MKTITLSANNEADLMLIKMLSERMGITATVNEQKNKSAKHVKKSNGEEMAEALSKIAANGNLKFIKDPVKWQRGQRKDRKLPGR